jgi:hypothetical protein
MSPRDSRPWYFAILAAVLLVLGSSVSVAVAARPAIIVIEIDLDTEPATETFTTDSPLLCPEGDAFTDFHKAAGNFWAAGSFHLNKLLVCEDGSGTFVITVDAGTNFVTGGGTNGGWSVVPGSGTGDYVGLRGGGNVVGINQDEGPVDLIDYYSGHVRL